MEIIGIVGSVFAATVFGAWMYERRMDVLYGPYIEGRARTTNIASVWAPARSIAGRVMDRLNWKARNIVYLAALI
jgi:hypothetical protein